MATQDARGSDRSLRVGNRVSNASHFAQRQRSSNMRSRGERGTSSPDASACRSENGRLLKRSLFFTLSDSVIARTAARSSALIMYSRLKRASSGCHTCSVCSQAAKESACGGSGSDLSWREEGEAAIGDNGERNCLEERFEAAACTLRIAGVAQIQAIGFAAWSPRLRSRFQPEIAVVPLSSQSSKCSE